MDPFRLLSQFLEAYPGTKFIHYHWVDLSGILRSRVLPKRRCQDLASRGEPQRIGVGSCLGLCLQLQLPEICPTWNPSGYDCLHPCWKSLRILKPGHASVMCCVSEEKGEYPSEAGTELNFQRCPRSILERVVADARRTHSLNFRAGFELEFYLFEEPNNQLCSSAGLSPKETNVNCHNTASGVRGRLSACVEACVEALEGAGVEVEQFLAESGLQQFEISTGPLPVLAAVDTLYQSIEIIKTKSEELQLRACFFPKPLKDFPPTGLHTHISINKESGGAHEHASECFLAGVMDRLALLTALAMPYEEDYLRFQPLAVGDWVSWGSNNRSTPIRRVEGNRFEFRALNMTSNTYLVLAAYLGAGLLGISGKQELRWKNCEGFLSRLDEGGKNALGIEAPMPTSLQESMKLLELPWKGLEDILGAEMVQLFKAVKEGERTMLAGMKEERRRLLLLRHF